MAAKESAAIAFKNKVAVQCYLLRAVLSFVHLSDSIKTAQNAFLSILVPEVKAEQGH